MRIHILGVGGTFMGALAILAKQMGHEVSGVDGDVYEPMASRLKESGIAFGKYEKDTWLKSNGIDCVLVGNALSRGHPSIEWLMNSGIPYASGPEWLSEHLLKHKKVIAVSGTHGKTSTATLIAWLLEKKGIKPGYLIGGVPLDLPSNVALGESEWFVIEADEYDTAFFDKRPKFMHYWPSIAVINNIEFDHADIYADLAAIIKQFGFFLRTIPSQAHVVAPSKDHTVSTLLKAHPWSQHCQFGDGADVWGEQISDHTYRLHHQSSQVEVVWPLLGEHNFNNLLAAVSVWTCMGLMLSDPPDLSGYQGVKRRLELYQENAQRVIYSDFGHHPTAIAKTLEGVRQHKQPRRLLSVIHMTTNSMHGGAHDKGMLGVLALADATVLLCDEPDAFDRVSQWTLPANTKVLLGCEHLNQVVSEIMSQSNTVNGLKASSPDQKCADQKNSAYKDVIVVFSNKQVSPLLEAISESFSTPLAFS